MRHSTDRILTTHVGSLPRSKAVTDFVFAHEGGAEIDTARFNETLEGAVAEAVRRQMEAGVDIVSDGEMSKISYATYIKDRITGFDGDSPRRAPADLEAFPSFLERQMMIISRLSPKRCARNTKRLLPLGTSCNSTARTLGLGGT